MSQNFPEGSLNFDFPDDCIVLKYDDCNFHTRHWCSFAGGSKGVDFVVFAQGCIWLVEVKDYRINRRLKATNLFDEVAFKVRDSLAGLHVLSLREYDNDDREKAANVVKNSESIRVVLHIEQPQQHSKLFPQIIDWKTAKDCLKRKIRTVDPRCLVGNSAHLNTRVIWSVH